MQSAADDSVPKGYEFESNRRLFRLDHLAELKAVEIIIIVAFWNSFGVGKQARLKYFLSKK